jgi:hypothetical protein
MELLPARARNRSMLSASIAVYRAQADSFGGRFDGKSGGSWKEGYFFQLLINVRDN